MSLNYKSLDPEKIIHTATTLARRVSERFPNSGLAVLAKDLTEISYAAEENTAAISRHFIAIRFGIALCLMGMAAVIFKVVTLVHSSPEIFKVSEFLQTLAAFVNVTAFISALILSLTSLEGRLKRRRALRLFSQLRAMAHLVDLHQQTKNPDISGRAAPTKSSPIRTLNPFELSRYYDYCSELLSLISILSALYVQDFRDPVAMTASEQIEDLTTGLSQKIWQKASLLSTRMVAESLASKSAKAESAKTNSLGSPS